ncbi:MAG: thioesterase family protein [Lacunisphaera sp.]
MPENQRPVLSSRYSVTPRYAETNQMGFVAEACYPRWLDLARSALLREHGFEYHELEAMGYLLPVLEFGLTFHRPALYDDPVEIVTSLRKRPTFLIRLEYEIRRDDVLLTTGFTHQAFVNRQLALVRPPTAFLAKLDLLFPKSPQTGIASV